MSSDSAVRVDNLGKCFHIYDKPHERLLQMLRGGRHRYYREFWALRGTSFEVARGEAVGIIGRNGSGKSTLLQLICGTQNPTEGTITIHGRVAALLELGSGFNPEFTGRENVYLNAVVLGLARAEIEQRFDAIAAFADIGDFIDQPLKTFSSGMVVRLAFAVAINVDPDIIVIDEALSVGDELFQRKCFARLEAIRRLGATLLFVSHSGSTVIELCDRCVLLDGGEQLAIGAPKAMVARYQRLLFAPADKRAAIRDAIKLANGPSDTAGADPIKVTGETEAPLAEVVEGEEYLDPHLVVQSTVGYESRGAIIERPRIVNLAGVAVNCLIRGRSYRYLYDVRFEQGAVGVRFGMLIKTMTGVELGGGVSAPSIDTGNQYVAAGTVAQAEFRFRADLNPGSYFMNAGVTGMVDQDEQYLHRLLDAYVFRIMPVQQNTATALIDFHCVPHVTMPASEMQS